VVVFDLQKPKQDVEYENISMLNKNFAARVKEYEFDSIVNLAAIKKSRMKTISMP